jgi:hypothetical protein
MFSKVFRIGAILGAAAISLTACTPPMPPEVKAAILEQYYTCIDGDTNIAAGTELTDAISTIQGSLSANCGGMTITQVAQSDSAQILIKAGQATAPCTATTSVPYAFDAAVVAATLSNASGLSLSPKTVAGIFDGSITKWNDPAIVADNAGTEVSTEPIIVDPTSDSLAVAAFAAWYKHLTGKEFKAPLLHPKKVLAFEDFTDLPENSIALIPFSVYTNYSIMAMTIPLAAGIIVDPEVNPVGVIPEINGMMSGGTQVEFTKNGTNIKTAMNFNLKPTPPGGSDVAPDPYDAIYPVELNLCGNPTKATRAAALYLLRQDSQGALTTLAPLPENLRAESLDLVSKGLPEPKLK